MRTKEMGLIFKIKYSRQYHTKCKEKLAKTWGGRGGWVLILFIFTYELERNSGVTLQRENFKSLFLCTGLQGNLEVFMSLVYFRGQITSHAGSQIHESRSSFWKIHASHGKNLPRPSLHFRYNYTVGLDMGTRIGKRGRLHFVCLWTVMKRDHDALCLPLGTCFLLTSSRKSSGRKETGIARSWDCARKTMESF